MALPHQTDRMTVRRKDEIIDVCTLGARKCTPKVHISKLMNEHIQVSGK
jgi:hypothetical protein